jgi:hypothetical protein
MKENSSDQKLCIACHQPISAEALKCHVCRQVQSRVANLKNKPITINILLTLFLLFLGWIIYEITTSIRPGSIYSDEISGSSFNIKIGHPPDGHKVSCIGELNNNSELRWDDLSLQAIFKDSNGEVIDLHDEPYKGSIRPKKNRIFRVTGPMNMSEDVYSNCVIKVLEAENSL